ncbi:MAG: hypothetical protein WD768_07060 [Phycisphaeraceae bacterium]
MPLIKMEVAISGKIFLATEAMPEEREAFRVASQLVREDPIANSELYRGKTDSKYALRFFRFGGCVAYFHYIMTGDPQTDLIRVASCKRSKPRRKNE